VTASPLRRRIALLACSAGTVLAGCAASTAPAPSTRAVPVPPSPTGGTVAAAPTSTAPASPPTTSTGPPTTSPATGLRTGPGPAPTYTVQPQPAPGTCHYRWVGADPLPDPACTPGAVNPAVTQATIGSTICTSGWTATVRPPERVTAQEKTGSAAAYGYTGSFGTAEYDHLVPLELGGDPNDPANLWVEPNDRAAATSVYNGKDTLEDALNRMVCSGRLGLTAAQQAIATDWVAASRRYLG
jgi:hypothetical protein